MEPNPYEAPKVARGESNTIASQTLLATGIAAMLGALFFQNVTLASNSYREVLIFALVSTAIADACLAAVVWRGPHGLRLLALVAMLPTVFIVADFIRRSNSMF